MDQPGSIGKRISGATSPLLIPVARRGLLGQGLGLILIVSFSLHRGLSVHYLFQNLIPFHSHTCQVWW